MFKIFLTILSIFSVLAVDKLPVQQEELKFRWPKKIFSIKDKKILDGDLDLVSLSIKSNDYLESLGKAFDEIEKAKKISNAKMLKAIEGIKPCLMTECHGYDETFIKRHLMLYYKYSETCQYVHEYVADPNSKVMGNLWCKFHEQEAIDFFHYQKEKS